MKQIYQAKRAYEKYDEEHYMLYLHEEREEYSPSAIMPVNELDPTPVSEPVLGYSYTGEQMDGGTLIEAKEATYESFVSGLIRNRYTQNSVEAMQSNMLLSLTEPENERSVGFRQEWDIYQVYREECKANAKLVLGY